jgi:hypothetical protein
LARKAMSRAFDIGRTDKIVLILDGRTDTIPGAIGHCFAPSRMMGSGNSILSV